MFILWLIFFILGLCTNNDTLKCISIAFGIVFIIEEIVCMIFLISIPDQINAIINNQLFNF